MTEAREPLFFIPPHAAAPPADLNVVGSKALGLLRMARRGVRVPPAFVLGAELCRKYFACGERLPEEVRGMLDTGLARLAELTGQRFGDTRRPLLLAVRSGAAVSMPGMLDTILNIGLAEHNLHGLLRTTGNPRLARDCYRRLVRDFTSVVHGVSAAPFDALLERHCREQGVGAAGELDSASLAELCTQSLETALTASGRPFPQTPMEQLEQAVAAVFRSWNSDKARHYRRLNGIDDLLGTAVTVQAMVFGNGGSTSGAGVGFTRNPASGDNALYFDFLFNAQGEDVVCGRHPVHDSASRLERVLPGMAREVERLKGLLEEEFHDMQDFEFTVADGRLYLLQTRAGKRTPWAALRIAVDLVREGRLTQAEALELLRPYPLERIERARLGADATEPLAVAVAASIGVAAGAVVFDSARAVELAARGQAVILVRPDIVTADVAGIAAAEGILTASGGRTSHAAVIARQLGKVCLVGCSQLRFEGNGQGCGLDGQHLEEGELITLDGDSGRVYRGRLRIIHERPERELAEIRSWRAS